MMKEIKQGFIFFILFSILTGLIYPIFITALAQVVWRDKANGSLIRVENKIMGSKLIGQKFTDPKYFHSRPSAIDYKGSVSGASNLGPTNKKLIVAVEKEVSRARIENDLETNTKIPADLVLSSASGLDPHISLEAAYLQAPRIASVRDISLNEVKRLILKNTENPQFKFLGKTKVNVLAINLELDSLEVDKKH